MACIYREPYEAQSKRSYWLGLKNKFGDWGAKIEEDITEIKEDVEKVSNDVKRISDASEAN